MRLAVDALSSTSIPLSTSAASKHTTSRKRSRELAKSSDTKQHRMQVSDIEQQCFDVGMDSGDEEDILPLDGIQNAKTSTSEAGAFVPFYTHLGGDDLDDDNLD
ncbi:unnamed protein product [Agarophyton chilense]